MANRQLHDDFSTDDRSLDDVFLEEEQPDVLTRAVGQEQLPADNDSPAAPARNLHASSVPEDHPLTDSAEPDEAYEDGASGEDWT